MYQITIDSYIWGFVSIKRIQILELAILLLIGNSMFMPFNQSAMPKDAISESIPLSLPSQEPVIKTWHHDCSNTSGFHLEENHLSFPIGTGGGWIDTEGLLESDGQGLQVRNINKPNSVENGYYFGPVFIYNLSGTFPVSGLRNLSAQIEIINSNPDYVGIASVILFDENLKPVLGAHYADEQPTIIREHFYWRYYPRNFSLLSNYFGKDSWDYRFSTLQDSIGFINSTWSASYISDHGINGTLPVSGLMESQTGLIVINNVVETMRAIKYLGILIGRYEVSSFLESIIPPFRIHDISLEYETGGTIDTTPPLLTPRIDQTYIVGKTGNSINWRCTDDHPYRYKLFEKYDDLLLEEGLWNGSSISISIDGLEVGNYGYTLFLQDKAGFIVGDFVKVQVIEDPLMTAFIAFINANWMTIIILSMVVALSILLFRDVRKEEHLRGERWLRSVRKRTKTD